MKYRKKPVVVDAVQWVGQELEGCAILAGSDGPARLVIRTLEGDMTAQLGDYVITGVKGERYSCREDIFLMTYEPAE